MNYTSSNQVFEPQSEPHTSSSDPQRSQILTALHLLTDLSIGCVEMRVFMLDGSTRRGFYDDLDRLAEDAAILDAEETATGIYFTLNPVNRELLLRSRNKLTTGSATCDGDIVLRRWLAFDFDPVRLKGTNSTDAEHAAALNRAADVLKFLRELGWCVTLADSSNGAHLLCRIDLPNDSASLKLVKDVLATIAAPFSDASVKVDLAVCNASRIWKLYGTTARKGEATDERPQRQAKLLIVPDELTVVTKQQLRALIPPAPEKEPVKGQDDSSVTAWDDLKAQLRDVLRGYKTKEARGYLYAPGRCHGSTDGCGVWMRTDNNSVGCFKGCDIGSILTGYGLPAFPIRQTKTRTTNNTPPNTPSSSTSSSNTTHTEDNEPLHCTDMGNGFRFARDHRGGVLYNAKGAQWLCWDGKRWAEDDRHEIMQRAKQTVIGILREAAYTQDDVLRKVLRKHSEKSEQDGRMSAMLNQAKSELPVRIDAFDGKPFAFNCGNGIVDLRTGELHPHDRAEMHTKLSPVMYDPSATAPKWETFLDRIFASDESLIRFVQRAAGYSLTGDVSEQCLFIAYGTGANGKSVFLKTIAALVADYGQATRTETLMVKRHVGVSNDIACLRGARFVSAFETDEGQRFAESNVKQLTGGDKIRARFLFKEEFEFAPQFKLWLAANHKPEIRGQDHAIWRRIKLIPFNVTIPQDERNAHLDAELQDELPGIFAWAVRGCMAWQSEGLGVTEAVKQATADYQFEMDALAEFFADRCEMDAHYEVSATEIYAAYKSWCQASGEEPESQKWLAVRLKERGCNVERRFKARIWKGIGLIKAADAT